MSAIASAKQGFKQYCDQIVDGVVSTTVGMKMTIRYFFHYLRARPLTLLYPEERPIVPPGHRGIHGYDESKCISCDMCANACPVSCIYIKSVGKGKDALMTQFDIDYTKCLFCDLCTEPCPTECIWMTQEFDLASYTKEDCTVNFARLKTSSEIAAHEAELQRRDEEKKAKTAAKKKAKEQGAAEDEPAEGDE